MMSERRSPSSVEQGFLTAHHTMPGWVQLGIKANGQIQGQMRHREAEGLSETSS